MRCGNGDNDRHSSELCVYLRVLLLHTSQGVFASRGGYLCCFCFCCVAGQSPSACKSAVVFYFQVTFASAAATALRSIFSLVNVLSEFSSPGFLLCKVSVSSSLYAPVMELQNKRERLLALDFLFLNPNSVRVG